MIPTNKRNHLQFQNGYLYEIPYSKIRTVMHFTQSYYSSCIDKNVTRRLLFWNIWYHKRYYILQINCPHPESRTVSCTKLEISVRGVRYFVYVSLWKFEFRPGCEYFLCPFLMSVSNNYFWTSRSSWSKESITEVRTGRTVGMMLHSYLYTVPVINNKYRYRTGSFIF